MVDFKMKKSFFSKVDWAAFWFASLVVFGVYFYTLGPSVGLEDSGELATASAHLGVPHPPGYPFWTLCTWIFCKIFSFVTYMGHPNPAWAVSCCSAFFGAAAAGCTAMLICRSARDFISGRQDSEIYTGADSSWDSVLAFGGGVGGALAFAFSPVEWSQSTIVEIYSLNSLFLMWVFLLSYRWMRKPSDKILWLTAFVFGLGLTNYQVLLFAIVPLAIIICLKNFRMFRDFALYLIPAALTYQVLKIAEMPQASYQMSRDVINKHSGLISVSSCPSTVAIVVGVALAVAAIVAVILMKKREMARKVFLGLSAAALAVLLLAGIGVFASQVSWCTKGFNIELGQMGDVADITAPLVSPRIYLFVAIFTLASALSSVWAIFRRKDGSESDYKVFVGVAAALAFIAVMIAVMGVDSATDKGFQGKPYSWNSSRFSFVVLIAVFAVIAYFVKNAFAYFVPVAGFHIALFVLLERGAMNGLVHPTSWWFWWPVAWNFVVLALTWLILPYGRSVAFAALFAQIGVSFYAYMPIVSDLRNPPMNWGYPRTWDGFKHAITRGQYEEIKLPEFAGMKEFFDFVNTQMRHYFFEVKLQFTDFFAVLALLPLACWTAIVKLEKKVVKIKAVWIAASIAAVLAVRALFVSVGMANGAFWQGLDRILILAMAFLAVFGVGIIVFKQLILRTARAFKLIPVRAKTSFKAVFGAGNVSQQWLIASGACFFMMTLPLILLAQVKGDIQDGFIQKVKFISSHAMIAMWIGYGLVFAGVLLLKVLSRHRAICEHSRRALAIVFAAAMIIASAITPIVQNYVDDDLVFRFGGSEQNDHTFGWQFGAYQLDGAKAIRAQLSSDEEPLPDPDYPLPMEPYSIFFGGTDPGRFVPTYMIYGANFRPDVYLITQNALADDTYMSVQRDLYGDEIWIPAKEDNAKAFDIYLDEVNRGVRRPNGDLRVENGRVQVTGALGVMEINGILTRMMFDHDRLRHAFYVEESYPIPWMNPYLSPHGLILRLNAEKTPYDPATARKDADFWDWYSRRLINDPMYRRDFAAQKSFSKLRAAIAGVYRSQGRIEESQQAFREAHLLYPASPEATFRYISEILLPLEKHDVVRNLIEYTDAIDPNNPRTERIYKYLDNVNVIREIEAKYKAGKMTFDDAKNLFMAYHSFGRAREAENIAKQILSHLARIKDERALLVAIEVFMATQNTADFEKACESYLAFARNPPAEIILAYAKVLHLSGRADRAAKVFDKAIAKDPHASLKFLFAYMTESKSKDIFMWIRISKLAESIGRDNEAMESFYMALLIDREGLFAECRRDMVLYRIYEKFNKYIEQNRRK